MTLRQRVLLAAIPALVLAAGGCSRSTADNPLPALTVEAAYPGANAVEVADTVAAPIEQQVNGVEKMVHMRSRSANDGRYQLTVTFERGTDLKTAQVLLQNRVALAQPMLPAEVQRGGVTVRKVSPGPLAVVAVASPEGRFDPVWLGNYAATQLRDELARLPDVNEVVLYGPNGRGLTVWLDPDKLGSLDLTAQDVIRALEEENAQVAAGAPAPGRRQEDRVEVNLPGRLAGGEELGNVVLKASAEGRVIRLKDVARVEVGVGAGQDEARLNGKPAVLLVLDPLPQARPRQVSAAAAARVAELRERCPPGVHLDVAFDFTPNLEAAGRSTTPDYLLLDPTLPPGASAERKREIVRRCEAAVREVGGVQDVLTLAANPFDHRRDRPCLVVRLAPAQGGGAGRRQVVQGVRDRLGQVEGVTLRLRDLSVPGAFPRCGYPIDLAVYGEEGDRVRELATKLAERLARSGKVTDVGTDPDAAPRPQLSVDVDRAQAKVLGVSVRDITATLQASGWQAADDLGRPGQPWQVRLEPGAGGGDRDKDIQRLKVRNGHGEMVPLSALLRVREVNGPEAVNRFNLFPAVEITANPAPGVSLPEAHKLCETLAEAVRQELGLSAGYRLGWLH